MAGPILDAYIGASQARIAALTTAKQPIPLMEKVRALLDTGASCTCVDSTVLSKLAIPATGTTSINSTTTGATPQVVNLYDVGILIPGAISPSGATSPPLFLNTVAVAESPLLKHGFQALIGRDILAFCVFHYNGPLRSLTVSY